MQNHLERILSIYSAAFSDVYVSEKSHELLQDIKQKFYRRDFQGIFCEGNERLLVYSAFYSPSRSCCYFDLFSKLSFFQASNNAPARVLSLGSGSGGELVALGMVSALTNREIKLTSIDIGDYSETTNRLETSLRNELQSNLHVDLTVMDLLDESNHPQLALALKEAQLVTAMFLFNELLTIDKRRFATLIKLMVQNMVPGSLLLVVDSAGSFSHVKVSKDKTYMCFDLLDFIRNFKILQKSDADWFRFPKDIRFASAKLENARYYKRVYQIV